MQAVTQFQTSNEHHGTCIHTKVAATVGLGFADSRKKKIDPATAQVEWEDVESKVDETLNPLCEINFQDVLSDVIEDFWQVGNGYMEIVRRGNGKQITGIHHLPAPQVYVFIEDSSYRFHYEIISDEGKPPRRFARFGELEEFKTRLNSSNKAIDFTVGEEAQDSISEVIHFRRPSSLSRWYGYPDWMSCVPSIELVQCLHLFKYDFFLNRGVPEFMLFILGGKLKKDDWQKVEDALKANIGKGNTHKSLALNLAQQEITVQLEKLAMEGKQDDGFENTKDNLAMGIVTAHRVPPLLAGILIPGKLGASNELANALMAFQALVCGPAQRHIQQTLGYTLGNSSPNGGLSRRPTNFKFRKITEEIDIGQMDTISRMREPVASAKAKGRDIDEGLKD